MAQATIEQAFDLAVQHHQAGRLGQAEQLYRQILARQPNHADALHLLGVIAHQLGRPDIAASLIRQAIAIQPNFADAQNNLGMVLSAQGHVDEALAAYRRALAIQPNMSGAYYNMGLALWHQGKLDEAIAAYRRALALDPGLVEAHNNLGTALKAKGQLDEAIAAYRQATALRPGYADAHYNLGIACRDKGQLEEAIAACREAIALRPDHAESHNNLGIALKESGRAEEAIAAYRRAIALQRDYAEAHSNLGNALWDRGRSEEAIGAYREAIALRPDYAEAFSNLGNVLSEQGQLDEAIAACRRAIALKALHAEAYSNLGNALWRSGEVEEAIAAYRRAIVLKPEYPEPHQNLGLALLSREVCAEGWEEYEWRWKCRDFPTARRNFAQVEWDGSPLRGRTILLHAEQGFGDTIQFIRFLPMVKERGGRVIIECQPELQRLLQTMAGGSPVVAFGSELPDFDVHCPLLSLPRIFGTTLESIPGDVPYVQADATDVAKWRNRVTGDFINVGLAWAGRPTHRNDRNRSIGLAGFASLAQVPEVRFFSLQKGPAAAEAQSERLGRAGRVAAGVDPIDWTEELKDFADTAALVVNLDLVIAVDTAVVHLAGALGKPVWTMLPLASDWRWMLNRQDSPWYPTMRLFRQPSIGDWNSVMRRAADALAGLARCK